MGVVALFIIHCMQYCDATTPNRHCPFTNTFFLLSSTFFVRLFKISKFKIFRKWFCRNWFCRNWNISASVNEALQCSLYKTTGLRGQTTPFQSNVHCWARVQSASIEPKQQYLCCVSYKPSFMFFTFQITKEI